MLSFHVSLTVIVQENFAVILQKINIDAQIIYETTDKGENNYWIKLPGEDPMKLNYYLDTYLDQTDKQHEIIRQHIVIASRNYHNRFKAFMRDIVMNRNNPMCIKHWDTKTEFQGRGAGNNKYVKRNYVDSILLVWENQQPTYCLLHNLIYKSYFSPPPWCSLGRPTKDGTNIMSKRKWPDQVDKI